MPEGGIDSGLIYRCAVDLPARLGEQLWRTNIIYLVYSVGLILAGHFVLPTFGVPIWVAWALGILIAAVWFVAVTATLREQKIRHEQLKELERNCQYFQYSQTDLRLFTTKYTLVTRQKGFGVPALFRQNWLFQGGLAMATFVIFVVLLFGDISG